MPFNMAANEVLANRANEILTGYKGSDQVHPNTHVNMCQSSNDVVPTAKGIAIHNEVGRVLKAAAHLEAALDAKAAEFADVVKMGRTCLQDAVPITLGIMQYILPTTVFMLGAFVMREPISASKLLVFLFIWVGVGCFLSGTVFSTGRKKLRQVTEIGRVKY